MFFLKLTFVSTLYTTEYMVLNISQNLQKCGKLPTLTLFLHKRRGLMQVKCMAYLPKNSIEFKLERRKLLRGNHVNELCLNHKNNSGEPCQQPLLKLQKQLRRHVKSSAWITKANSMSPQFWQCCSTLASQTACRDSCIKISNSSQPMIHKDDNTIMLRCWCTICSWILYCNFQRCSKGKCIHRDLHIAGAWALHQTPLEQH
jgi:hypothetical protein